MNKLKLAIAASAMFSLLVGVTLGSALAGIWMHSPEWSNTAVLFFVASMIAGPIVLAAVFHAQA